MRTVEAVAALRETVAGWRHDGARVGFVPTMGNLHKGHYSLLDAARARADRVVASVFVNPTQFGPREDFASYPRTLAEDAAGLEAHGCDLLFAPTVDEIYPYGPVDMVRIEVPIVSAMLEGEFRPGHFAGVATVVTKLFNLVQPDVAVFGQKDYQQLLVIRRMVRDLALPIEIVAAPTLREANGLAMSSRNQYLTSEQRAHAGLIHQTLRGMGDALRAGVAIEVIERDARATLEQAGFQVDYIVLRRGEDLGVPEPGQRHGLVALAAAKLGRARLIDNFLIDL
jgi:pantoate--beta-alanine ligase